MQIHNSAGRFQGASGLSLYYQSWHPVCSPKATIVMVHGLGSHCGWFDKLAQKLIEQGYVAWGIDLRGHGRSPGKRGHINDWGEFQADLAAFVAFVKRQASPPPYFLLGHSLGAAIAIDYLLSYSTAVAGAIVLAPALGQVGVARWKLLVGRMLSWVYPQFTLNTGIDLKTGVRDRSLLEAYAADSLRHTVGTARLSTEFLKTVREIQKRAGDFNVPLLMLLGGCDRVTEPEGSKQFFQRVASLDKVLIEYADGYHELHTDANCQQAIVDIINWLNSLLLYIS